MAAMSSWPSAHQARAADGARRLTMEISVEMEVAFIVNSRKTKCSSQSKRKKPGRLDVARRRANQRRNAHRSVRERSHPDVARKTPKLRPDQRRQRADSRRTATTHQGRGRVPNRLSIKKEPDCSGSSDKVIYAFTKALRRVVRPTLLAVRTSLRARPFCQP